jgi:hypothetical protein
VLLEVLGELINYKYVSGSRTHDLLAFSALQKGTDIREIPAA